MHKTLPYRPFSISNIHSFFTTRDLFGYAVQVRVHAPAVVQQKNKFSFDSPPFNLTFCKLSSVPIWHVIAIHVFFFLSFKNHIWVWQLTKFSFYIYLSVYCVCVDLTVAHKRLFIIAGTFPRIDIFTFYDFLSNKKKGFCIWQVELIGKKWDSKRAF